MFYTIDRRRNPPGKSLGNSQRFKNRAREAIKAFVDESVNTSNSIKQLGNSEKAQITSSRVHEPTFHLDHTIGDFIYILPGNTKGEEQPSAWIEGDQIPKPEKGSGKGRQGSTSGGGNDDFEFALTEDEKYQYLFEDLELPNQEETVKDATAFNRTKAGFTSSGSPANFALKRTMKNSIGRRLSMQRPRVEELEQLEEEIKQTEDSEMKAQLIEALTLMRERMVNIPYIDTMDVKFHHIVKLPRPVFKAVMFCVMDVSGSMTERMKDLAKRFYILLYRFLKQKYEKVEVVFIRHHHQAKTVTEDEFFYSPETGGTIVSKALDELILHITNTFDPEDYNIYIAQASDGDNSNSDNPVTNRLLRTDILPHTQYYAYLEIGHISDYNDEYGGLYKRDSDLWPIYEKIQSDFPTKFAMKKANKRADIFPVFRELFQKRVS